MGSNPSILVCAEDTDIYLMLDRVLSAEGVGTLLTSGPDEVRKLARNGVPDLILLDCRRQSFSASEVCGGLRKEPRAQGVPIIALVGQEAEDDDVDRVRAEVDEAVSEQVSPRNLLDCLRSRLRRNGTPQKLMTFADVKMDLDMHRVWRNGRNVHLGPIEFRLLRYFLQKPEQVLSRDELISEAWEKKVHVGPRTVDVHMGRLRKALNSGSDKDLIRTVRSVGYALSNTSDKTSASSDEI